MGRLFRWILAPAGLVAAHEIVQRHVPAAFPEALASYLAGATLGLYFGLLLRARRNSDPDESPEVLP